MRLLLVRMLMAVVLIGLVLLMTGSMLFGLAVRRGFAPEFDRRIGLDAQHILVIHNGQWPTCWFIPNPPQHDCFWPGAERREFSVDYLTPHGVWSLIWFQMPE